MTLETYEEALSELLDIVKLAENNEVEQNTVVLRQVADYLMEFSIFVKNTDEIIDPSVSLMMVCTYTWYNVCASTHYCVYSYESACMPLSMNSTVIYLIVSIPCKSLFFIGHQRSA